MSLFSFFKHLKLTTILFWLILILAGFLRLNNLSNLPPSPYWEETAIGYDAYSILKTGRDHHGAILPIVAFESFGDWKPSLYFYAVVPFIKLFGLTTLAVRLPAALSGIAIVIGVGILAKEFASAFLEKQLDEKYKNYLQLVVMALTAISPWAILFSRAGWEVNLATALIVWGIIIFVRFFIKNNSNILFGLLSVLLLVASTYTYHAARVIAPLLGMGLVFLWWNFSGLKLIDFTKKNLKQLVILAIFTIVLTLPLVLSLGSQTTNQRFAETSIFSDITVIEQSNQLKEYAENSWWSKIIYHRYLLFGQVILANFLSHFTADFLFLSGDLNPRHSIQYMGQLYFLDAVFVLIGAYVLIKRKTSVGLFLTFWLVVGILPASITKASPHALRTLPIMPVMMILTGVGVIIFLDWTWHQLPKKSKHLIMGMIGLIVVAYLAQLLMFWRFYTKIYPAEYSQQWQYGYQQMVSALESAHHQNPELAVFVTREYGRPAMYYWFYTKTDPLQVQSADIVVAKDQSEFLSFDSLTFFTKNDQIVSPAVVASTPETLTELEKKHQVTRLETVYDLQQKPIWVIYSIE